MSTNDAKALIALATYQYLSAQQMVRLGVGRTAKQIRDHTLKRLERARMIKSQDFGAIPKKGRLPLIYCLSPKSINVVADLMRCAPEEITYPKYGIKYAPDYFHRRHFVDFHIALRQWVESRKDTELEFFQSYYTKHKGRGSKTHSINLLRFKPSESLPYNYPLTIDPDGIFRLHKGDKSFLCAIEHHRKPDSQYITRQLDRHMTALDQNLLSERFDHQNPNLVLSVHENLRSFTSVQKRLLSLPDFEKFIPYFHFALHENLEINFSNWVTANEEKSALFG